MPGGKQGEYVFKVTPSDKPLLGASKVRRKFRLSFVQESSSENELIAILIYKRVGHLRTQRKLTLCPKANERIKGPRLCTM